MVMVCRWNVLDREAFCFGVRRRWMIPVVVVVLHGEAFGRQFWVE